MTVVSTGVTSSPSMWNPFFTAPYNSSSNSVILFTIRGNAISQPVVNAAHNKSKNNSFYYPIYMLMFLLNDDFEIKIPSFRSLSF